MSLWIRVGRGVIQEGLYCSMRPIFCLTPVIGSRIVPFVDRFLTYECDNGRPQSGTDVSSQVFFKYLCRIRSK